eukprot:6474061-Amphidinium_carterae.1
MRSPKGKTCKVHSPHCTADCRVLVPSCIEETADVRLLHAKPPLLALCGAGKPGPQTNDLIDDSILKWEKTCSEALSFPDWPSLVRSANRVKDRVELVCFVSLAGMPKEEEELWAAVKAAFP